MSKVEELEQEIKSMEKEEGFLVIERDNYKHENEQLRETIEKLQDNITEEARLRTIKYKERARSWETQYHDMKRKYEESKQNVDDYALERLDRVTDINKEQEKVIRELKEELAESKRTISNLHYDIKDRVQEIENFKIENEAIQNSIKGRAYTIEELAELKEILFPTAIVRDKLNRRLED